MSDKAILPPIEKALAAQAFFARGALLIVEEFGTKFEIKFRFQYGFRDRARTNINGLAGIVRAVAGSYV